jgi:hypothetical protein
VAVDLHAVRAEAGRDLPAERIERYGDVSSTAALYPLGEPVPAGLGRKANAQVKKKQK